MRRLFKVGADRHDVGKVTFSWHPEGNFLASAGRNGIIHVTDRHGDIVDEIPMSTSAPILTLQWDKDGEYLAILQEGNGVVPLWSLSTKRVVPLETNLRDPTFLSWSKTGPQLAIGTAKGSLLIYNKTRKQKIPVVGKHSKMITCGGWSKHGNKLVLGSDDKTLTISNENGDTLLHTEIKHIPLETHFTYNKTSAIYNKSTNDDNVVSANLNGKSLLLYNIMDEKEDPMELTFATGDNGRSCKYGDVISHHWFEEGLLLVGFSGGYLLSVSTNSHDLGEEKYARKFHQNNLTAFTYNSSLQRAASVGDDGIRIIDIRDFNECKNEYIIPEDIENGRVCNIEWSPDGQILTIATTAGNIYNFLAKMSILYSSYQNNIGYLSSLREISIIDTIQKNRPIDITVKIEPSFLALGPNHIAVGMNNHVYYHTIPHNNTTTNNNELSNLINEEEYIGIVKEVQLNKNYSVILTDTKAILHPIEKTQNSQSQTRTFPTREEGLYSKITCIELTEEFLYYGTEAGTVEIFFINEFILLTGIEIRLDNPIKKIKSNYNGTKLIIIDSANQCFLYNPVLGGGGSSSSNNTSLIQFIEVPTTIHSIIWDYNEKNVIMLYDGKYIHSYIYVNTSIKGSLIIKLGPVVISTGGEVQLTPDRIELISGNIPIVSNNGSLTCQTLTGNISTIIHPFFHNLNNNDNNNNSKYHNNYDIDKKKDKKYLINKFCQSIALLKLNTAWEIALELDKRQFWLALSGKAMELMNIELACRIYRQLGDAGMVLALQECLFIEDKYLLSGKIALLFCDYQRAQELFLLSSNPTAALDMRRDLLQWDQALALAQVLSIAQIPDICIQYGQQLEFKDDSITALKMFEEAINIQDDNQMNICPELLIPVAMNGIARCNLRLGNIRQGIRLANELDNIQLFLDCGNILEQLKQYSDAASMYMKGLQYEKAGLIYTKYLIKNDKSRISEAAVIMEKVESDQLNSAFAKVCVAAGRFEDALRAYERAKDIDKVVELKLRHLDQVQQAFDLVRSSASAQGAQYVADYCSETSDYRGAIEFLLIANKSEEAFKLAQSQSIVDVYAGFLGTGISAEDAIRVAQYYEKSQNFGQAGRFYALCNQFSRALRLFIQCGDREIDAAIDVVGKSQNESLTHQLIDFLVGEKDGVPKDPNYIYRLYLALKKYEEAAKTALIIARQEQDLGNYKLAHNVIIETIIQLETSNIKVSLQLRQTFILLHSYILVKMMVKRGNHENAARLLLRITQNISKFPLHIVQLLTSTVIECQRAGLKSAAYENASILMRPEYRSLIDVNLKRKIEAIVRRRPVLNEEPIELTSKCPISNQDIPIYQLECPTTRDSLPMCIITGQHMIIENWCFCPISKFPALYTEYIKYIEDELQSLTNNDITTTPTEDSKNASPTTNSNPLTPLSPKAGINKSINRTLSVPDPILGKSVTLNDLVLSTPEEALKYIQKYNNMIEKNNKNKEKKENENNKEEKKEFSEQDDSNENNNTDTNTSSKNTTSTTTAPKASKGKIERARRHRLKKRNI